MCIFLVPLQSTLCTVVFLTPWVITMYSAITVTYPPVLTFMSCESCCRIVHFSTWAVEQINEDSSDDVSSELLLEELLLEELDELEDLLSLCFVVESLSSCFSGESLSSIIFSRSTSSLFATDPLASLLSGHIIFSYFSAGVSCIILSGSVS